MAEVLAALLRANLAAGVAILLVLALRTPVRKLFGADAAYRFWIAPPLAALASLLPARVLDAAEAGSVTAISASPDLAAAGQGSSGLAPLLLSLWLIGGAVGLGLLAAAQWRFLRRVRRGQAGPAVVGFVAPRMVTPADYESRFTDEERQVVRAHERVHMDRNDPRTNALIAMMQAVNWFNPLIHLGAAFARLDQELACDAAVLRRYPLARRRYAQTLLKTQLAARALPAGCHWGAASRHPLEARVEMLAQPAPCAVRRSLGAAAAAGLAVTVAGAAWAVQPPRAAQPSFYRFEAPQLWSVEVVSQEGGGAVVRICTDATLRAGFARPTPVIGEAPCLPDAVPTGTGGVYAFRCSTQGRAYGVSSVTQGDLSRDFTTALAVDHLDSAEPGFRQTRRHRRLGACPSDWIIGDQTGQGGVMIANAVSAQRRLDRS